MTAAQRAWLGRTRAYVRTITFDPHDSASALLLTDGHRLHARLEEAHGVCVINHDDDLLLATATAVLPRFAALRVLSLPFRELLFPLYASFVMALPRGLRQLTYLDMHPDCHAGLALRHLSQLEVRTLPDHGHNPVTVITTNLNLLVPSKRPAVDDSCRKHS